METYSWMRHGEGGPSLHLHEQNTTTIKGINGPIHFFLNTSLCGRNEKVLSYASPALRSINFLLQCGSCVRIYKSKAAKEVL